MEFIPNNINHIWSAMIMEELHRQGVKTVCIAPGSRSTPLTWAAAEHPDLTTVVHFDERGLAFHALGLAKAGAHPVALVCTSGSAVANMLPAVVEASMSHTPLILLTADRPFELVDCGA
ncbi:MAG: thiamine pyrophosphate-binding protein, partial [Candidatus Hydrogenedentota bacterium]